MDSAHIGETVCYISLRDQGTHCRATVIGHPAVPSPEWGDLLTLEVQSPHGGAYRVERVSYSDPRAPTAGVEQCGTWHRLTEHRVRRQK